MKNIYTILEFLAALTFVIVGICGCTDELEGLGPNSTRPTDVVCFTASLSNSNSASQSRSASGQLEIEQEEWLVDTKKVTQVSRGTPTTLLSGSAGVIGYVYGTWSDDVKPWSHSQNNLYNKEFKFDGDELTAASNNVRWNTLNTSNTPNVRFYAYAPYNLTGGTLSSKEQGGSPQLTYTVNDTPSEQHDFIIASWEGQSDYKQSIPLVFNHALTAVRFKVGFDCTVKSLEVKNICNSGTYTFGEGWTNTQTTEDYTFSFGENGSGQPFSANAFLTDGDNTLMMIPQTLSSSAQVKLTYIEDGTEKTITSTIAGKVWQAGKMITYTIHKTSAPTTIYFDLAAGNVTLGSTYNGKVYVNGTETEISGTHEAGNVYYVYQSTESNRSSSGIIQENGINTFVRPPYNAVKRAQGELWRDYIINNTNVVEVIDNWVTDVANAGRKGTPHYITVNAVEGNKYQLTIDNLYSTHQTQSQSRRDGGIAFEPETIKNCHLIIKTVGDNRFGNIHYYNKTNNGSKMIFEGEGSLTVADVDRTNKNASSGYTGGDIGYFSNYYCSVIGGNDDGTHEVCYGIVINSGILFAGSTVYENCSAIGGGGNGLGEVEINGGVVTAVAATTGTAIGGGIGYSSMGGYGIVRINGGNVYAYNLDNMRGIPSSAIGGAGSSSSTGTKGEVTINGGNVYAFSALGTAIGGGSSRTKQGGDAEIHITGGMIIAKSGTGAGIGGGSAYTTGGSTDTKYNGGTAIVDISGNPIIRTGSIGGGNTGDSNGKIGSASINISGGDIQAQFVMAAGAKETPEFTMSGGTIRNSYVDDEEYIHIKKQGGAVYLEDGTFTMSGGTIKNCSAEQGGAVYINSQSGNSTFTMTGGEVHSCFATGTYNNIGSLINPGHGGAVCLMGGQVNLQGGKIWNNYSENGDGGALYISNGNFSMTHSSQTITENYPTITGNAAQKGNGGGVFVSSENGKSVDVDLLQGIITNNTANNYGGGVCVDMGDTKNSATVIVGANGQGDANPKISENMAMMSGGGLYVRGTKANVTINSGMIDENEVSAYVKNEDVTNEMGGVTLNAGLVTHVVVTFNGNGGITSNDVTTYTQNIVTNTNSKLALNRFERDGYRFTGWNTRADGLGDSYSEEDATPHASNITLYAQWKAK